MIYRLVLDLGVVINEAGEQVAPCQSNEDPALVQYLQWIAEGNQPNIVETLGS